MAVCRYLLPIYILVISLLAESAAIAAPSFTFTDDPLTSQVTSVKAVHITELRQAINTLRSRNSLSTFNFNTDPSLTAGVTPIRAAHITEMRTALNGVFDALVQTRPTYTDPTILAGQTVVKRVHISEIRNAVGVVDVFTLTVNQSGIGNGTVTSSPAGISCGVTCTATFAAGTSVTLTAAAVPDFPFAGFSGGSCSGTGPCTVTINSNITVTATFDALLPITFLSTTSAVPGRLVTVTGSGFDPAADLSVRFFDDGLGFTVDVPALDASTTSVIVAVPPVIDPVSGDFVSGTVDVELVETSGGTTLTSNTISGFQIEILLIPPTTSGTVTLSFLLAARDEAIAQQNENFNAPVDAALSAHIANLDGLIFLVQQVVDGATTSFPLGSFDGTTVEVFPQDLFRVDQMIIGIMLAFGPPGVLRAQSQPLSLATDMVDQRAVSCMEDEGLVAANFATQGDPGLDASMVALLGSPNSTACAIPDAFNTAYLVVGGAAAVGIGILVIAGTPALAVALPTAALLYVTIAGGAGEIALGGALAQSTTAARELVQAGVERVENALRSPLESLVIPKATGALLNLVTGARDLIQAVATEDLTIPPTQLVASPTSLSFGSVAVGSSSTQSFTVTNTGGGTLTGNVTTSPLFTIVSGGSFSLGAGTGQTVTVRFSPTISGLLGGSASVTSNGGNASVILTGTGTVGTASISVFDSGSAADDAFSVAINGVVVCTTTIGASNTCGISGLQSGIVTLTITCTIAPDDLGTFTVELAQGLTFASGGTSQSGGLPEGGSQSFQVIVP